MELVKHEGNGGGGMQFKARNPIPLSAVSPLQSSFVFNYNNVVPSSLLSLGYRLDFFFSVKMAVRQHQWSSAALLLFPPPPLPVG